MPQSGVTSVRSWYLTSFVILSFYCLSVCLTLLTVSTQIKSFLNGEYRGFWVLLLRAERRILYLVALAVVRCRFTPMPSVFRTVRIVYMSTNYTHMESLLANQWSPLTLPRFCKYPSCQWNRRRFGICRLTLQGGVTQAYMGLLLLHLNFQQNLVGVVHRGNPPSPGLLIRLRLRCSLDCTSLGLRLYYSIHFLVWQLANCQKYKIIFCLQGRICA